MIDTANIIATVLNDIRQLGEVRGWSQVSELADLILSTTATSRIIVAAPEGLETDFIRWLHSTLEANQSDMSSYEITSICLEELAADITPALLSDKVVAVFEAGRLIEPEQVDDYSIAMGKLFRWLLAAIELREEDVLMRRDQIHKLKDERQAAIDMAAERERLREHDLDVARAVSYTILLHCVLSSINILKTNINPY